MPCVKHSMSRFSLQSLPKNQRIQLVAEFYDALASLKSRAAVQDFVRDLLHPSEIAMLMRRIEAGALILAGYSFNSIKKMTGIGTGTASAVKHKLMQTDRGAHYRKVVQSIIETRKRRVQKRRRNQLTHGNECAKLKRSRPLHFLFSAILDEIEDAHERKSRQFTSNIIRHTPSRK